MTPIEFDTWIKIKRRLSEILTYLDSEISQNDKDVIQDFIENNEYGVALDWINSIIDECNIQVTSQTADGLRDVEAMIHRKSSGAHEIP